MLIFTTVKNSITGKCSQRSLFFVYFFESFILLEILAGITKIIILKINSKVNCHKIDSKIQFFYTVWWSFDEKSSFFRIPQFFFFFLQRFSWITTFRYNKQCKWKNGVISRKWQIRSFFSKEENCDIVQNDIVQAVIILICLQSIYKQIQNSEKKLVLVEKNFCLRKVHAILYADF